MKRSGNGLQTGLPHLVALVHDAETTVGCDHSLCQVEFNQYTVGHAHGSLKFVRKLGALEVLLAILAPGADAVVDHRTQSDLILTSEGSASLLESQAGDLQAAAS